MSAARERREGNGFIALKTLPQVKIKIKIISLVIACLFPVLFIISLSDYNQTLFEDGTTNRMQESEKVFGDFFLLDTELLVGNQIMILFISGEMLNNVFFRNTPFIVFFNKVDLFQEKIKTTPLTLAYRDYSGPQQYEPA